MVIFFTCLTYQAGAQIYTRPLNLPKLDRKPYHFGFHISYNTMNFGLRPIDNPVLVDSVYSIETKRGSGFSMGIMMNVRMNDYFSFRVIPTLSFGSRSLVYTFKGINDSVFFQQTKRVESTYLELPLLIRYRSARLNNIRALIEIGGKYSFDLSSKAGLDDKGETLVKLKKHDLSFEMGVGMDFYLPYFKFSPVFRVSWGVPNVLYREDHEFSNSINRLYTRMIMLSLFFEGSL